MTLGRDLETVGQGTRGEIDVTDRKLRQLVLLGVGAVILGVVITSATKTGGGNSEKQPSVSGAGPALPVTEIPACPPGGSCPLPNP